MDELLCILRDIVVAEYAQWMRYTYLSSLGFGLDTGSLKFQFETHAHDELHHAQQINKWLVDLGDLPPTEVPCVEQFSGTTEEAIKWILDAEISGLRKYNYAYELASALGLYGLQSDIGQILEREHEHTREMFNLVSPHFMSGDHMTTVIVANSFNRFAAEGGEIFKYLVIDRFADIRKRKAVDYTKTTWQELAQEEQQSQFGQYLTEALDKAMEVVTSQVTDTNELLNVLPEKSREWLVQDIENQVHELWQHRDSADARSAILFFKDLYTWLTSQDTTNNWRSIYEQYVPGWQNMFSHDWEQELYVEPGQDSAMEDIFQHIQEMGREPEEQESLQPMEEQVPEFEESQISEEPRRPIEPEVEKTLTIMNPDTKQKNLEVSVGDEVFNSSAKDVFRQNPDYGLNAAKSREYATGIIKEIRDDGSLLVEVPGAEDPFDEQIWSITDKLWGSRPKGQRVVN